MVNDVKRLGDVAGYTHEAWKERTCNFCRIHEGLLDSLFFQTVRHIPNTHRSRSLLISSERDASDRAILVVAI